MSNQLVISRFSCLPETLHSTFAYSTLKICPGVRLTHSEDLDSSGGHYSIIVEAFTVDFITSSSLYA